MLKTLINHLDLFMTFNSKSFYLLDLFQVFESESTGRRRSSIPKTRLMSDDFRGMLNFSLQYKPDR